MNLFKRSSEEDASLCVAERAGYGIGNTAMQFMYIGISTFLLYYYTNYVGLDSGIVGTIILFSKLFDGVSDLIMGGIIDRTNTKTGKARIWLVRSCIPFALATVLLFAVPGNLGTTATYIFVFVSYNLANTVCYTCVNCAYNTLSCVMTKNQYERGLLGIFSMIFTVIGQIFVSSATLTLVNFFGGTTMAWTITFAVYAAAGLLMHVICIRNVHERVRPAVDTGEKTPVIASLKALVKNKYWIMFTIVYTLIMIYGCVYSGSLLYYAQYVLGNANYQSALSVSGMVVQMIFLVISAYLIKKYGKGMTFNIGMIIIMVGVAGQIILSDTCLPQVICSGIKGAGVGFAGAVSFGIAADTVEYGEWKTGVRVEGMTYSGMTFASKIGSGLGSALIGWMLSIGGFDANLAVQSQSAILAIRFGYVFIPAITCVIMMVIMWFYDLDKRYDGIIKDLAAGRHAYDKE